MRLLDRDARSLVLALARVGPRHGVRHSHSIVPGGFDVMS